MREENIAQKNFKQNVKLIKRKAKKSEISIAELVELQKMYEICNFELSVEEIENKLTLHQGKFETIPGHRERHHAKAQEEMLKNFKKIREDQEELLRIIDIDEISKLYNEVDAFYGDIPKKISQLKSETTERLHSLQTKYEPFIKIPEFFEIMLEEMWSVGTYETKELGQLTVLDTHDMASKILRAGENFTGENLARWKSFHRELDREVLRGIKRDITNIKSDFIMEQRQISANNRLVVENIRNNQNQTSNIRIDDLKSLKDLLDSGILTQEEFESEKGKILNS